jgi:hypothetical protein
MRAIIRNAIIADPALILLGVTGDATLNGDVDTPDGRPFLNLKWGTETPAFRETTTVTAGLDIWVHHEPWDYDPINKILARLRVVLQALGAARSPDGSEVQVVTWQGNGPDLQDDGHRTIVKVGSFQVVGKV